MSQGIQTDVGVSKQLVRETAAFCKGLHCDGASRVNIEVTHRYDGITRNEAECFRTRVTNRTDAHEPAIEKGPSQPPAIPVAELAGYMGHEDDARGKPEFVS